MTRDLPLHAHARPYLHIQTNLHSGGRALCLEAEVVLSLKPVFLLLLLTNPDHHTPHWDPTSLAMSRTPSSRAKKTPSTQGSASKSPLKTPKDKTPSKRLNPLGAAGKGEEGSPTPKGRTKRFADSLEAVSKATPKRTRGNSALPSFDDDVFGSSPMSQEAFRANERLKRQREARNFVFEGDANAPRQTRSGRVVESVPHDYGEDATDESADEPEEWAEQVLPEPEPEKPVTQVASRPLLPQARKRIVDVLATLNGRLTEPEDSKALTGLVALLSGTVVRGEGNSCLVTGPRGAGKTRVSIAHSMRLMLTPDCRGCAATAAEQDVPDHRASLRRSANGRPASDPRDGPANSSGRGPSR